MYILYVLVFLKRGIALKKAFLLGLIFLIAVSVVFSQDEVKNTFSVQLTVIGAAANFERTLTPHFSVLAEVSYTNLLIANMITGSVKGRWYPFSGVFFLEMGAGYATGDNIGNYIGNMFWGFFTFGWWFSQMEEESFQKTGGLLLQPGLGWKIDIGEPGGFFMPITLGMNIKFGSTPDYLPVIRIGLGYSF